MDKNQSVPLESELRDIRDIKINPALSREERLKDFIRQIKDPYCFKCGKFTVRAHFSQNGVSLEDCLKQILI